ncbi:MaoC family dehydratase N-terminal domain-containing protein [Frankia sp. R43]|uniref:FAS1-like dehydratase domain-containing protein n=1 Tax=Frankia sp. R43 TaxID=269536 RepID=UPI0006CA07E7|nr:MaoC family dehydratase N-terminal domain-containing protein [Frankia sp. R43]
MPTAADTTITPAEDGSGAATPTPEPGPAQEQERAGLADRLRAEVGARAPRRVARHPVNEPMIAHWCDAIGDANPAYTDAAHAATTVHGGLVAPPAMLDVWDRHGLLERREADDPRARVIATLEQAGFISVVAVNAELEIHRYLRPGDLLGNVQTLADVSAEKRTALGVGHFVTSRHRFTDQAGEHVGDLLFRILKFRPGSGQRPPAAAKPNSANASGASSVPTRSGPSMPSGPQEPQGPPDPDPARRPRPAINRDNQFFWDGTRARELRIQRCDGCGALFSPPTARCWHCGGFELGWIVASGRGRLYSHAVVHHPPAPGFRYPLPVGLIELAEGTRVVADLVGCPPTGLRVGMPVELTWVETHPALVDGAADERGPIVLPAFRPAPPPRRTDTLTAPEAAAAVQRSEASATREGPEGPDGPERFEGFGGREAELALWSVPVTATLIVSGAIATRDFQPVHHDRELAARRGSADIFLNINTSVGLLQRYVSDALGPDLIVRAIRVRLGAPAYPGDHLVFTGRLTSADARTGRVTVAVRATGGLGDHLVGAVEVVLPGGREHDEARAAAAWQSRS